MANSVFHKLSRVLWAGAVLLIVLLAMYVSMGRYLMGNIGSYQGLIIDQLNQRVPFVIEAERVAGEWQAFTPELVLSGLRLSFPGQAIPPIHLDQGRLAVDPWETVITRQLQGSRLRLEGLELQGQLDEDGELTIAGFGGGGGDFRDWFEQFLRTVRRLELADNQLSLALPGGQQRELSLDLLLEREGSRRLLSAQLTSDTGTSIRAQARGLGNPFDLDSYNGELYLDIDFASLASVSNFLPEELPLEAEGDVGLEVWVSWASGTPTVEVALEAGELQVRPSGPDPAWELPLEALSLAVTLAEERNLYTLYAEDVRLRKDGTTLVLPRLQLDLWGDSLRLRSTDVDLEPLNTVLTGLEGTPEGLAEVFRVLRPRGRVEALQFTIEDLADALDSWQLEANFSGVAVESWRGAPGVRSAAGYVELAPGGGFVTLDARQFAMAFPSVYREPLFYEDFFGTISIDWDAEALQLGSGAVTAVGEEGTARALFGLRVPFDATPEGIEMDLLVGLQDARPVHRVKYLPYTLDEGLLDWLQNSIGDGQVEQGAFLWRGSLNSDGAPYRTVQLAFNIADTTLNYDPRWPPITELEGIVLIDDTNVSVWSDRARLFDSAVQQVRAEAWMDAAGEMQLAVAASVQGDAGDALRVVNESPLDALVGSAFSRWQLAGPLTTELKLGLNLNRAAAPPEVVVRTRLEAVDLRIEPGALAVDAISGALDYRTGEGFSSRDLQGSLWGENLQLSLRQAAPASTGDPTDNGAGSGDAGELEILASAPVAMADLRQWLGLDALGFAEGRAPVELRIVIDGNSMPRLTAGSTLLDVSLDLPSPWAKSAGTALPLQLAMPLGGESQLLELQVDDALALTLDVSAGSLRAGSLLFLPPPVPVDPNQPVLEQRLPEQAAPAPVAPALVPNRLRVTGHTALVDVEEWQRFVTTWLLDDSAQASSMAAASGVPDPNGSAETPAITGATFRVSVEQLRTDRLLLWGQSFDDVVFSLALEEAGLRVGAQTDWLKGHLALAPGGDSGQLLIDYVDLAGLDRLELPAEGGAEPLSLPTLEVRIAQLRNKGRELGDLGFGLRTEGAELLVDNIAGTIAGLQMSPEQPGQLRWDQGADVQQTRLETVLTFADLGLTLEQLGYERTLETEGGLAHINFSWPGGPQAFAMTALQGALRLETNEGRFLEAPAGTTGALRVVSILNLADIVRRLSLTQMFESGIPFERLRSQAHFHGGTLEVSEMDVRGSGSEFQFSGLTDLEASTINGELVVTLPVANNLPWVAALAAGLPVAAGVFVVSKVFENQMDRFSSGVYRVTGPLDDPEVVFDRIFDNSAAAVSPENDGAAGLTDEERDLGFSEPNQPASPPSP